MEQHLHTLLDTPFSTDVPSLASAHMKICSNNATRHERRIVLDHHIFTHEGWERATSLSHPALRLRISTLKEDYIHLGMSPATISPKHIDVVADSGAQSCLWSRREFLKSGFNLADLIKAHHTMEAAKRCTN